MPVRPTRRSVLGAAAALMVPAVHVKGEDGVAPPASAPVEPIIDIHQHTNYAGRTDAVMIEHQRRMGVTQTILLPSGRALDRPSTNNGVSNGLQAKAGGNETCVAVAKARPGQFFFFANEVPDLPETRETLTTYLKAGGLGIGEQKFHVEVDSPEMEALYEIAAEFRVPVLMHFQTGMYNLGYSRLGKMLEKHPKTTFIGHAQTMWAHIDKDYVEDAKDLYPKPPKHPRVAPGGITDQYLSNYPNFYSDLSAGSGLNSMVRDEDHARGFLERHQDKIIYGSDCNDPVGHGPACQGWLTIQEVKKLATSKAVERKILYENAKKMFRI